MRQYCPAFHRERTCRTLSSRSMPSAHVLSRCLAMMNAVIWAQAFAVLKSDHDTCWPSALVMQIFVWRPAARPFHSRLHGFWAQY